MITVIPRDPRAPERVLHRAVQAVTDRHLIAVGTALIPEPLNIDDNDGPVNSKPLVLHLSPHRQKTAEAKLWLTPKPDNRQEHRSP